MRTHTLNPLDEQETELTSETASVVSQVMKRAVMASKGAAPAVAVSATLAGIEVIAAIMGNPFPKGESSGEKRMEHAVTQQSALYGALVVAASLLVQPTDELCECGEDHGKVDFGISFGPHSMHKAAEWFEQLTGEKPDPYLQPGLVDMLNEVRSQPITQAEIQLASAERPSGFLN